MARPSAFPRHHSIARRPSHTYHIQARVEDVLHAYATQLQKIAGPVLHLHWCIEATRLCIQTLAKLGISARPVEVAVWAQNEAAAAGGRGPAFSTRPVSPWSVECNTRRVRRPTDVTWDGHLVAYVEKRFIVDGAIAQFQRPAHAIHTPDVLIVDAPGFAVGTTTEEVIWAADGSRTTLRFMAKEIDRTIFGCGAWRCAIGSAMAAELASGIAESLGGAPFRERRKGLTRVAG